MPFRFVREGLGQRLILENEPEYCHKLDNTNTLPPRVVVGKWIIYYCADWSAPDMYGIGSALAVARWRRGEVQLGIRFFADFKEVHALHAEVTETYISPIWVVLRSGRLVAWFSGLGVEQKVIAAVTGV